MTTTEGYRLSPQQRRIWQLHGGGQTPYRSWCVLRVAGHVTPERAARALTATMDRHEILRTTFQRPAGTSVPVQVIHDDAGSVDVALHDLRTLPADERAARYTALRAELTGPCATEPGPVLSATLVRLDDAAEGARLVVRVPALCADEESMRLLGHELAQRLDDAAPGTQPLQYADFATWQDELLTEPEFELEREFWQRQNSPRHTIADLPFAQVTDTLFSPSVVSIELADRLDGPVLALANWRLLLRTLTGQDLAIAVRQTNRVADEMADALGPYEKYAPSVVGPETDDAVAAFVDRVAGELAAMADGQSYFDWSQWESRSSDGANAVTVRVGFDWHDAEPGPVEEAEAITENFAVRLSVRPTATGCRLNFWFDQAAIDPADMRVLAAQYAAVLRWARADPDQPVRAAAIPAAPPSAPADTPTDLLPVHVRFAANAQRDPGAIAVRCLDRTITNAELDERANRLAGRLRAEGAGPLTPVGICLDRSIDLVVAVLGVLKSGAPYLPLDPGAPLIRRTAILTEAGARIVVAPDQTDLVAPDRTVVPPDAAGATDPPPPIAVADSRLAYVVFTSGSTGTPKGVAVSHANLAAYVDDVTGRLDLPAAASYAMVSTPAADLGNTMLFAALCNGGTLHLLPHEYTTDPALLGGYLRAHPVDCLKIVPSHLRALLDSPAVVPPARLVLGGEAADWDLVRRILDRAPRCRVLNHYGPTEATVGVLTHEVGSEPVRRSATVPLGTELPHSTVEVLDDQLRRVPTWAAGEIYIGGAGVALGYLNRPGLTAERFVPDPFGPPGTRLYRTGDRARRLADGTIVFLGRTDSQLKVRGHRVEPGEIEAVLRAHPAIRQAAVLLREASAGTSVLTAYVTSSQETTSTALREHCAARLPEYLVPGAVVLLDSFPLTPNGKLDFRALPTPSRAGAARYRAPETPVEIALAEIWQQVLGVPRVGLDDNFFALGGDSILGIQVMSRAAQAGLSLTPKLLFQYPTVGELAPATRELDTTANGAEQRVVTGPFPPTPIQRRFLSRHRTGRHHYNQEILVAAKQPLAPEPLRTALLALITHHDALRIRVTGNELDIAAPTPDHDPLATADLSGLPDSERRIAFTKLATDLQSTLDLGSGCLFRALLADLGPDGQRLLLIAHHLSVDGVSWRVLMDDLTTAYRQAAAGDEVRLPPKTTSYPAWAVRLADEARTHLDEVGFWTKILTGGAPAPQHTGANTYGAAATITVTLDEAATRDLVRAAGASSAQAMLLAALGKALSDWTGAPRVVVDVESHGRDAVTGDVDVSRTVGWFTTIHPIALTPATTARTVKEQLAEVPANGVGHDLLKYGSGPAADQLRALPEPWIRFNYHGNVIADRSTSALFDSAPEDPGPTADPTTLRPYLLDLTAAVVDEQLQVSWTYCPGVHAEPTVRAMAASLLDHLRGGLANGETGWAPSDFPLADLDQNDLDTIASMLEEIDNS
ncbi:MAG TPA: amino acid adenylation domain-containing protein [Pseudonocardiaceae bacterium]